MRIQLELSENSVAQIKDLMKEAGIKTYSDIFGNSLALLNWAVKETRKGRKIVSADPERNEAVTELAMPVLDAVAAHSSVNSTTVPPTNRNDKDAAVAGPPKPSANAGSGAAKYR